MPSVAESERAFARAIKNWWLALPRERKATIIAVAVFLGFLRWINQSGPEATEGSQHTVERTSSNTTSIRIGDTASLGQQYIGCEGTADAYRIVQLWLKENDIDAAVEYAMKHSCASLKAGTIGRIEDLHFGTFTCLRPDGEPSCYWLPTPLIKRES